MLQLSRYTDAHVLFANFFTSKLSMFHWKPLPIMRALSLKAGLYRPSSVKPEYSMFLSMLSGRPTQTHIQLHGKRRRKTLSLNINVNHANLWYAIDKLVHELIPRMQDLMTPKSKKRGNLNVFTLRLRQKFITVEEFEEILESNMYESHKGIYLPLTLHFHLVKQVTPSTLEIYLRMLRLPINLHRRKPRPAYDDKVVFSGLEELYRQTSIRKVPRKKQ